MNNLPKEINAVIAAQFDAARKPEVPVKAVAEVSGRPAIQQQAWWMNQMQINSRNIK